MDVYVVFRRGHEREQCGGVFTSLCLAKEAARQLLLGEASDHYDYEIIPFELGKISEQEETEIRKRSNGVGTYVTGGNVIERDSLVYISRNGREITEHKPVPALPKKRKRA